jgi:hypothetical protein
MEDSTLTDNFRPDDPPAKDFEFSPAVRRNTHVLIALAGASGSGKTKSALELAMGLAGGNGNKIGMIDTESRRGLHYANGPGEDDPNKYRFQHSDMLPPFRPHRFEEGIEAAEAAGLEVLIIDSFSHEWDGDGGMLEWADSIDNASAGKWQVPKKAHKKLVQTTMLQARCHLILCLRAEEKISIYKKGDRLKNGTIADRNGVEPLGWSPICEKRLMFEMTLSFTLSPTAPGIPQFDLPHKLQDQHRPFFPEGERISRKAGQLLDEWAKGGAPNKAEAYIERVRGALSRAKNAKALSDWWKTDKERETMASSGLSQSQVKSLMGEVTARIEELKSQPEQESQ